MTGDLLVLSGRFVEEVRLMENARVSVKAWKTAVSRLESSGNQGKTMENRRKSVENRWKTMKNR